MTDDLPDLIKRALAEFDKLTDEQKEAHWRAQRYSWARGERLLSQTICHRCERADIERDNLCKACLNADLTL